MRFNLLFFLSLVVPTVVAAPMPEPSGEPDIGPPHPTRNLDIFPKEDRTRIVKNYKQNQQAQVRRLKAQYGEGPYPKVAITAAKRRLQESLDYHVVQTAQDLGINKSRLEPQLRRRFDYQQTREEEARAKEVKAQRELSWANLQLDRARKEEPTVDGDVATWARAVKRLTREIQKARAEISKAKANKRSGGPETVSSSASSGHQEEAPVYPDPPSRSNQLSFDIPRVAQPTSQSIANRMSLWMTDAGQTLKQQIDSLPTLTPDVRFRFVPSFRMPVPRSNLMMISRTLLRA